MADPSRPWAWWEWAVAALAVLLPVVRAITMWRSGWLPLGDNANIGLRAADVGSRSTPLVGMQSGIVAYVSDSTAAHPGPLVFWVLAPWVQLGGRSPLPMLLGCATVVASASFGLVWCARQLAGRVGSAVGATVLVLILFTTATPNAVEPLNPGLAMVPAVLALFAAALAASGDRRAWPILVASASFAAQADVVYAPTMASVVVAVIARRWWLRRRDPSLRSPWSRRARWTTGLTVAVCWIGPVADAIFRRGGNVSETLRTSLEAQIQTQGWPAARDALISIGDPLGWVSWIGEPTVSLAPKDRAVLGMWLVVAAVVVWRGFRSRGKFTAAVATAALPAMVSVVAFQAMTPSNAIRDRYYLLPVLAVGALVCFGVCVLLVLSAADRIGAGRGWLIVGLLTVALSAGEISTRFVIGEAIDRGSGSVIDIEAAVVDGVPPGRYLLRSTGGPTSQSVLRGVSYRLEERGIESCFGPTQINYVGPDRICDGPGEADGVLLISRPLAVPPPSDWELVAEWAPPDRDEAAARAARSDLVRALRRNGLQLSHRSSPHMLGELLAVGTGADPRVLLDDEALGREGQRFIDEPSTLDELPDALLGLLCEEGILRFTGPDPSVYDRDQGFNEDDALQVWLVPSPRRELGVRSGSGG